MTLNEFLGSYEFTEKYTAQNGHDVYDYNIIEVRVYNELGKKMCFGFGFEDFAIPRTDTQQNAKLIFKPELLEAKVTCLRLDTDTERLIIYLDDIKGEE